MLRSANVRGASSADQLRAYLPRNYAVVGEQSPDGSFTIVGSDVAGWTLDDYVIPRLASGLIFASETSLTSASAICNALDFEVPL